MKSLSQTGFAALLALIIVITVILLALGFITLKYWPANQENLSNIPAKTAENLKHPKLYQTSLEYDPVKKTITQLKTETVSGLIPVLSLKKPKENQKEFTYKLVVSDKTNMVIDSGWVNEPKEYIQTRNKRYRFWVTTEYIPGAIIRLYYPEEKLIWTGVIDED